MNAPWSLICLLFSFVFFAIAAFAWPAVFDTPVPWRLRLVAFGLMAYILSLIVK
jgi:hypothetical protein